MVRHKLLILASLIKIESLSYLLNVCEVINLFYGKDLRPCDQHKIAQILKELKVWRTTWKKTTSYNYDYPISNLESLFLELNLKILIIICL